MYNNKTVKQVAVVWDKNVINTSKIGSYKYTGAVKGYNAKVLLILNVIGTPTATPTPTPTATPTSTLTPTPTPIPVSQTITSEDSFIWNGNTITKYIGTDINVIIPDRCTAIGNLAFFNGKIETIDIPASVKSIGNTAFMNCKNLKSVKLSEGLLTIGQAAFMNCLNLENINIPLSVIRVDIGAFMNFDKINIPINPQGEVVRNLPPVIKLVAKPIVSPILTAEQKNMISILQERPSGNEALEINIQGTVNSSGGKISTYRAGAFSYVEGNVNVENIIFESNDLNKVVSIGSKIYMIDNDGVVKEYDPLTDIWNNKYQISELRQSQGIFKLVIHNNCIYIIGENYTDILKYNPSNNVCESITKLPTKRTVAGAVAVNNKNIY